MVFAAQAQANDDVKVYVGAGVGYSFLSKGNPTITNGDGMVPVTSAQLDELTAQAQEIRNQSGNLNFFAGVRLNDYVGFEAGYTRTFFRKPNFSANYEGSETESFSIRARQSNVYADVLGYYPIAENLELVGSVGVARAKTNITKKDSKNATEEQKSNSQLARQAVESSIDSVMYQPRIGAGLNYHVTSNVSVRGMVRYQNQSLFGSSKKNPLFKDSITPSLEVAYTF
jgi:opacity protein-like surface antigen